MPIVIDPGAGDAIGLDDLVEALAEARVDCRDTDAFATLGPLLARLARNRDFLADLAIAELKARCAGQIAANAYGPQVLMLRPPDDRHVLRANFWPAATDRLVQASGESAFVYGMAHDHDFPFLTCGYLGPGYVSEDYERNPAAVTGQPGERAGLRATGTTQLREGTTMLYRASIDVHRQRPPQAFSVSLNILGHDPEQRARGQYRFDIDTDTIAAVLSVAPGEALLALAVHFSANGIDIATDFAARHPCPRTRRTARDALATVAESEAVAA